MKTTCKLVASALVLAAACSGVARAPKQRMLEPKEIFERSRSAIVRIEASSARGDAVGTGFVLTADGRIATNLHVVGGATSIEVVLLDGTRLAVEQITAADLERDLAIVAVHPTRALPTLALGDSDGVAAGDPVVAIGNPLGVLDYTVSDGLISSVRLVSESLTLLQISAPISQGSSGGPLLNRYGEVIGVATFISTEGQNLNFGIPSNYLRPLMGAREGLTPAAFAERFRAQLERAMGESGPRAGAIERQVPEHQISVLAECSDEAMLAVVKSITEAISLGAPLYNEGNHEACFRIYEGTAIRLERESECPGLRDALGHGLLRATTEEGYTAKAWAMRDTFDGIMDVITRKAEGAP